MAYGQARVRGEGPVTPALVEALAAACQNVCQSETLQLLPLT